MGVTRSIPALEGQGPPILLGRTTVNALAGNSPDRDDYLEFPPASDRAAPSGGAPDRQEVPPIPREVVDLVLGALELDAVRASLLMPVPTSTAAAVAAATVTPGPDGLPGAVARPRSDTATPSESATTTAVASPSPSPVRSPSPTAGTNATPRAAQPTPTAPAFSFADNLAPGRPAASVVNFVNGSKATLDAYVRPVILSDTGLCPALRMSIAVMAKGAKPIVLGTGDLVAAAAGKGFPIALTPGAEYTSVVLFNIPGAVDNRFQGRTCTVDVLLVLGSDA